MPNLSLQDIVDDAKPKEGYTVTPDDLSNSFRELRQLLDNMNTFRNNATCNSHINVDPSTIDRDLASFSNYVNNLIACSCNVAALNSCDCETRTSVAVCTCDYRTSSCDCVSRTSAGTCRCDCRSACDCQARVFVCTCNFRTMFCDCQMNPINPCICNARCGCDCDSRTSAPTCNCNVRTGPCDCDSRTGEPACNCNTECTCNTESVFS